MTKLNKIETDKLNVIARETDTLAGLCYMTEKSVQLLVEAGYVECNLAMAHPSKPKQFAVRATPSGIAYIDTLSANNFVIEDGIEVPSIKRKATKPSIYPFDALEIGQSFFVPATDKTPNPAKSLASTVSSASKRYAIETGTRMIGRRNRENGHIEQIEVPAYRYVRKFMVRSVEENGIKGARVWRIKVEADTK